MSTNVIAKQTSTTSTSNTSATSYLSMMTPNVTCGNVTTNKRRESSTGEDSVSVE